MTTTKTKRVPVDIQKAIEIAMVFNGEHTKGWVHTWGMEKFGKPELEIRNVPIFMMSDAGHRLNVVADAMLNSDEVFKLGETMKLGRDLPFRFKKIDPIPGEEGFYSRHDVWTLSELEPSELECHCSHPHNDEDHG